MSAPARAAATSLERPALPPRWVPPVAIALCLLGLAVSVYLTIDHYAKVNPYCVGHGIVNCQKVTTSAQSVLFGVLPVPVLGLVFFVGMLILQHPAAWRAPLPAIRWLRLASALVGVGFVCYLIYTELFVLDAICLWCTSVHAITLLLFVVTVFGTALAAAPRAEGDRARR